VAIQDPLFLFGEQIHEQGGQTCFVEFFRHEAIARTVPSAAAAVREGHDTGRSARNGQIALQHRIG